MVLEKESCHVVELGVRAQTRHPTEGCRSRSGHQT